MKKILCVAAALLLVVGALAACGPAGFKDSTAIAVISREEGSGTRSAFEELLTIEATVATASVTNSTAVMMTSVAGDMYAIGYISMGSMNDTVKALQVGGVDATAANVMNGTYAVSRPFILATKEDLSANGQDFINFIMSAEGQKVVTDNGYVSEGSGAAYASASPSGTVVVAGSSSVTPLMEALKEAYEAINGDVEIQINTSDSSTGMTSTIEGICEIGMASRELKDTEISEGLSPTVICMDGIAVIVNKENPATGMTADQIMNIYNGTTLEWNGVE